MKAGLLSCSKAKVSVFLLSALVALPGGAFAQKISRSGWASENDPVAKQLIEQERKWATLSCTPSSGFAAASLALIPTFIAPDFVGTSPRGPLYTRADMLPKKAPPAAAEQERDCKLLSARVRYFGPDVAVIYGKESAVVKGADGKESTITLVWTDTLLRRAGKWQVIAVQDMVDPRK